MTRSRAQNEGTAKESKEPLQLLSDHEALEELAPNKFLHIVMTPSGANSNLLFSFSKNVKVKVYKPEGLLIYARESDRRLLKVIPAVVFSNIFLHIMHR